MTSHALSARVEGRRGRPRATLSCLRPMAAAEPSRPPSPSCPSRACASRRRSRPRRSSAASSRRPASSAATCACPASARARSRRRSSSSASAARPSSTRPSAARLAALVRRGHRRGRASTRSATPTLDLGDLPAEGQPLTFTIEIGVRPTASSASYKGVEVAPARAAGRRGPAIDARSSSCASASRAWRPSSAPPRTATSSSSTTSGTIDGEPFDGGEGRDQMLELGSGPAHPRLRGAARGRSRRRGAHDRR